MQRSAEEGDLAAYGLAAGKSGNGLIDHGAEDGRGEVTAGSSLVDKGLNVRFGKYAAPCGNGVDLVRVCGGFVQPCGIGLKKGCHLVDKRAGAACAHAVHAFIQSTAEIDDLGILAAQFDGDVGLRVVGVQRRRDRTDLLHEADVQRTGQPERARACDAKTKCARTLQKKGKGFLRVRTVAFII